MNEEELNLIEKFKRLSPHSRRSALAQITGAAEQEERVRQYGLVSGSVLTAGGTALYSAHTADDQGCERLPGAGVRA